MRDTLTLLLYSVCPNKAVGLYDKFSFSIAVKHPPVSKLLTSIVWLQVFLTLRNIQ